MPQCFGLWLHAPEQVLFGNLWTIFSSPCVKSELFENKLERQVLNRGIYQGKTRQIKSYTRLTQQMQTCHGKVARVQPTSTHF